MVTKSPIWAQSLTFFLSSEYVHCKASFCRLSVYPVSVLKEGRASEIVWFLYIFLSFAFSSVDSISYIIYHCDCDWRKRDCLSLAIKVQLFTENGKHNT